MSVIPSASRAASAERRHRSPHWLPAPSFPSGTATAPRGRRRTVERGGSHQPAKCRVALASARRRPLRRTLRRSDARGARPPRLATRAPTARRTGGSCLSPGAPDRLLQTVGTRLAPMGDRLLALWSKGNDLSAWLDEPDRIFFDSAHVIVDAADSRRRRLHPSFINSEARPRAAPRSLRQPDADGPHDPAAERPPSAHGAAGAPDVEGPAAGQRTMAPSSVGTMRRTREARIWVKHERGEARGEQQRRRSGHHRGASGASSSATDSSRATRAMPRWVRAHMRSICTQWPFARGVLGSGELSARSLDL